MGGAMTQDEIIEMAKQAGKEWLKESPTAWETTFNQVPKRYVEIFAQIVASKEREACKAVCEKARYATQPDYKTSAIQLQQAQPEQEPDDLTIAYMSGLYDGKKQRKWVGLTDEEVHDIVWSLPYEPSQEHIRAIEAKLKEKNA